MSDTATPSTLASVFILESDANSWTKLEGNGPLSQLHVKFWRKDMTEEAQEWRRSHPLDIDELWDDISPGCYALDFGIEHLERSKLWIRNDYLRIYDYCNQHYDTVKSFESGIAPSVVITGQAGVGKSYWIYFAVRRRLGEGKPFIWYRTNKCFLFVEEGVFVKPLEDVEVTSFVPFLWTFVDADNSPSGIPSLLADPATKLFNIFVTFPRQERWTLLGKTTNTVVVYMCRWMQAEIVQAAHIHGFTDSQLEEVDEMYDKYGPTPRICIDFVNNPDISVQYKELYTEATKGLLLDRYLDIYSKGKMFDMDELAQTVFLLVPELKAGDIHIHHRLEPISQALKTKFDKEIGEEFGGGKRIRLM